MNFSKQESFNSALYGLPIRIKNYLNALNYDIKEKAEEIRLRANKRIYLTVENQNEALNFTVFKEEIEEAFLSYCKYSIYSHEEEIKEGYINLDNGHRLSFGGKAVIKNGQIATFTDINSLNIRISKQIYGFSDSFFEGYNGGGALIFGPPGCGKTTMLRDIARKINKRVCIIDTKGEIAIGSFGECTDVLFSTPKDIGIQIALRNLHPEVIIFDEIASYKEVKAVSESLNAGVPIITTAHAGSLKELKERPVTKELLNTKAIDNIFFLQNKRCIKI